MLDFFFLWLLCILTFLGTWVWLRIFKFLIFLDLKSNYFQFCFLGLDQVLIFISRNSWVLANWSSPIRSYFDKIWSWRIIVHIIAITFLCLKKILPSNKCKMVIASIFDSYWLGKQWICVMLLLFVLKFVFFFFVFCIHRACNLVKSCV